MAAAGPTDDFAAIPVLGSLNYYPYTVPAAYIQYSLEGVLWG